MAYVGVSVYIYCSVRYSVNHCYFSWLRSHAAIVY